MNALSPVHDLDDAASIEAADRRGILRSAASGGAQVRAASAAVAEGALSALAGMRPRSMLIVTGNSRAEDAAKLLVAIAGSVSGVPIVHLPNTPPWVGPLDVVLVAGDDAADPRMIEAVDAALRRGAEVVVAGPDEGPLRAVGAGRAMLLPPRVTVREDNTMLRFLACACAVLAAIDPRGASVLPTLDELADAIDGEAMLDRPANEVFRNPAKSLAARMQNRRVVLAGDDPATVILASHGAQMLLRSGVLAADAHINDVLVGAGGLGGTGGGESDDYDPIFHDDEIDGPRPQDPARVFVLTLGPDFAGVRRRTAALPDVALVTAEDAADSVASMAVPKPGGRLIDLAMLTIRLELTAAYSELVGGR